MSKQHLIDYYAISQEAEKHFLAGDMEAYERHVKKAQLALMQYHLSRGRTP